MLQNSNKMVDFLIENWQICVSVLLALLTLVAQFAKRKVKPYSWLDYAILALRDGAYYINFAENHFESGEAKKKYVMEKLFERFGSVVPVSDLSSKQIEKVEKYFSDYIENVLTTPQKKEVKK